VVRAYKELGSYQDHVVAAFRGDESLSLVQDVKGSVVVRIPEALVDLHIVRSTGEPGLVQRHGEEVDVSEQR
jgi:hypothetical protein